jgi:hypothetical protein
MFKFSSINNAEDLSFSNDENADVIEIHGKNHVLGIAFCTVKIWQWIWTKGIYPPDDEFNRVIEFQLPTLGIMVIRKVASCSLNT